MYVFSLKENAVSLENQKQNLLQELEKEKAAIQQINAKNAELKSYLRAVNKRLSASFTVLDGVEERIGKLNAQISILKAENSALLEERKKSTSASAAKVNIEVVPASR